MSNFSEWINEEFLDEKRLNYLNNEFSKGENFKHLTIDNLFKIEKLKEIQLELNKLEFYLEDSDLYQFLRTSDFKDTNNNKIKKFREFLMSKEFSTLLSKITGKNILSGKIDIHSLKLKNGNYLLCHDDMVQKRKIAFILNFSELEEKDGGNLEFLKIENDGTGKIFKKITPKFGRYNLFEVSNNSYHQISELITKKDRLTIGGWYYE